VNLKEIEKVVGSIQNHLFRNSNSYSIGMLRSHFKGSGLQFKEHQVYAPGDDVRFIDWKLSAKTNTTFIKTFEEERNVEIYAILDISSTMYMGYKGVSKLQAAIEIICLLYLLADKTKDKVSVIIFTNENKILPLASGHKGIVLLISQLEKMGVLTEKGKVDYSYELTERVSEKKKMSLLKSFIARGKQVVYLTDFDEVKDVDTINKLIYRRNMHCFKMESPVDAAKKLPFSIFGKRKDKNVFVNVNTTKSSILDKGRYKKINVKERYLENFIREML
jgi:uncharacterized protein (DUF58 family)